MSNKANTKEKFIETASRLFEAKGYNATGLNEILNESGAPKGSLYYHFPKGKEELALESVNLAGQKIRNNLINNLDNINNPVEAIMNNIDEMAAIIDKEQRTRDLSISLIALETYMSSEQLRKACEDIFSSIEEVYVKKLIEFGINRERAEELGIVISAMVEGGITLSLTKKNGDSLRLVARQIPLLIKI